MNTDLLSWKKDGNLIIQNMIQELAVVSQEQGNIDTKVEAIKQKYASRIDQNSYLRELLAVNAYDTPDDMELEG